MTYAELKTRTQTVLRRSGTDVDAIIEAGLAMAHDEIQSLPTHDWTCQQKRSPASGETGALLYTEAVAADGIALPTDFMRHRDLWFDQEGLLVPLEFLSEDQVREKEAAYQRGEIAKPTWSNCWRILNGNLVLWPAYEGTMEQPLRLDYYARLPFYTGADSTDWFSVNAANALVFGAAWLVCLNLWNDERANSFSAMYQGFLAKAIAVDDRNAGGPRRAWTPPRESYARRR